MADKDFGVKQINLIGASGTPTISSPNNLNLDAVTVAISTDLSIGGEITSNVIVGSGYSVGIGSTQPKQALDIAGTVRATGFVNADGTPITSSSLSYWVKESTGIHTLSDVGIGTTNPASKLDVYGNITISGNGWLYDSTDPNYSFRPTNWQLKGGGYITESNTVNGYIQIGEKYIYGLDDVTGGDFNIQSNGNSYFRGGNLGVGTNNPTSALTVKGTTSLETLNVSGVSTVSSRLTISKNTETQISGIELRVVSPITDGNNDGIFFTQTGIGTIPLGSIRCEYTTNGKPDFGIYTRDDNIGGIGTESQKLIIKNNGFIGIGTTNPTSKLSVDGNVTVSGTTFVGSAITMYASTGIISATTFYGNLIGSIDSATNLTGGTANASSLNVSGIATISSGRIQADAGSNLRFGNLPAGSGSGRNIAIGDQVLASLSGGQGRNIGIGELSYYDTTTGQYNVGVGERAGQKISTGSYNVILGAYDGNSGNLDIRTSSNNVVIADGQGNIRQYINSSGNVGIKTTAIKEALTVAGIVSATGFYGTLNAGQLTGALPALDGSALTGVVATGSGVEIRDDGSVVGTAATINFGSNLSVSFASGTATVSGASSVSTATTAYALAGSPNVSLGNVTAGISTFNTGLLNVNDTSGVAYETAFVNVSGTGLFGWRRLGTLGQGQLELSSGTYLDPGRISPLKLRSNTSIELGSFNVNPSTYVSDIEYAGFSSTSSYLNHNNSKKIETTGYGVSVYGGINAPAGIITASSFSGSGSGLTNIPSGQLTGALPAIDGSALLNVNATGEGIVVEDDSVNIGSAKTVNFGTGLDVVYSSSGIATITASGGSLQSRTTVVGVTSSIANNGIGNTNITGFKSYALMKVGLSTTGWLRLYTDSASRAADASRSIGEDPTPGSGVIAEVITTGISTSQIISPFVMGGNLDNPADTTIYAAITNLSGSTQAITANLTILQLEA